MTAPQANAIAIPIKRPVSLTEAFLLSLTVHVLILVILFYVGLLSLLLDRPVRQETPNEDGVRFSFAPEVQQDADGTASESGVVVPVPPTPPAESAPDDATQTPDPDARATLDDPSPRIDPVPGEQPLPDQQGEALEQETAPIQPETPADSEEPPSDGLEQGVTDGETREPEVVVVESTNEQELEAAVDTDSLAEEGNETELELPQGNDAGYAMQEPTRLPDPVDPPAPGRPQGPSLDERISDFGRAVQRLRATPTPQAKQEPAKVFEPDWPSLPPTGQALGNLRFESGDFDWEDYGRQIYWIIWRTWHNRLLARVDDFEKWAQQNNTGILDHINGVRFTIESNGEISSIVLEAESGMIPFDLSATEALDEAVLPPLPEGFPRDSETVHAQFIGYGQIGIMRRSLQEYKRRGWF